LNDLDDLRTLESATLDGGKNYHCDLCWRRLDGDPYEIVELRVICEACRERWEEFEADLLPGRRVNCTIGLVVWGKFAPGSTPPKSNELGGREHLE
jgi:hypothetical protein